MIFLKLLAALVLVLILASVVLRIRKLRRDDLRAKERSINPRLVSPPPSPYQRASGFKILDREDNATGQREPARPRLEPDRDYVFSDSQIPVDDYVPATNRHNEQWALSRSTNNSALRVSPAIIAGAVAVFLLVGILVAYGFSHH